MTLQIPPTLNRSLRSKSQNRAVLIFPTNFYHPVTRQISIEEFGERNDLDAAEIRQLKSLFGSFATEEELLANARRRPRFR